MIADGSRFVVSVVPPHLLPSAQGVLHERLGGLAGRSVYYMRFDRYTAVELSLLERLRHATRLRGVLLIDPTSLKSVLLKFIEGAATLQGEVPVAPAEPSAGDQELLRRLQRILGLGRRRGADLGSNKLLELRAETRTLADVLSVFRSSVGLLDEVDLLLHPLRSELNWPYGERKPIYFAPLRWQLPFTSSTASSTQPRASAPPRAVRGARGAAAPLAALHRRGGRRARVWRPDRAPLCAAAKSRLRGAVAPPAHALGAALAAAQPRAARLRQADRRLHLARPGRGRLGHRAG